MLDLLGDFDEEDDEPEEPLLLPPRFLWQFLLLDPYLLGLPLLMS